MKKLITLILFTSSFAWASTTKEQIKESIDTLASILPEGRYEAQAFKKNLFRKLVPWKGKICEVIVSHDNSQPNYESYGIGAFVKEKGDISLAKHANMSFGLLSVESRTSIALSVSEKELMFVVDHADWETSTLQITENSFHLKTEMADFRGGLEGDVYCGKLVKVQE